MGTVTPTQVNPNDEVTDSSVNTPINQLAAVINGNIDNDNISNIDGSKIANGSITPEKWTNNCVFSVYLSTPGFSLSAGSGNTKIPFDVERFDTSNSFDATTNHRFTAPVNGYYHFDASIHTGVIGALRRFTIYLFKNGVLYEAGTDDARSDLALGLTLSTDMQLNSTDYVEIFCFANDAQVIDVTPGMTRFSGHLITRTT